MLPIFIKNLESMLYSVNNNCIYQPSNKKKFKIHHEVTFKSKYVIYFMECTLCKKQYVGKAKTTFNIRLNYHRKDFKNPACSYS